MSLLLNPPLLKSFLAEDSAAPPCLKAAGRPGGDESSSLMGFCYKKF